MSDRYEAVANRLNRSIARDWLVVAATSITLGGAVGALAVGSSSLHTMVAFAAELPSIPSPTLVFQHDDEGFNTDDDNDLPVACRDAEKAANVAEQLAAEAERKAEKLAEQAERLADSVDDCDSAADDISDGDDEKETYDET